MPPKRDWNNFAQKFDKFAKRDDYPRRFAEKIRGTPCDTVLDLGCGNGSFAIEISKKVKHVTSVDIATKMLEIAGKNAKNCNVTNITFIEDRIEDLNPKKMGQYDIVVASRSLGVYNLKKELKKIDELARKYVYITMWNPKRNQLEANFCDIMGLEYHQKPDYIYLYNMLYQLGIYANVELFEEDSKLEYCNVEEAINRCMLRMGLKEDEMNEDTKFKLKNYLKTHFKEKNGDIYFPKGDKPIMIWWKK